MHHKITLPACSLLLALVLLAPGCATETDAPDPGAPVPVRLKEPLKLGQADIVAYPGVQINPKRSEEIMGLVSRRILEQRNISMQLGIIYTDQPSDYVMKQVAVGKPPAILERAWNDRSEKTMPSMLRLNEAIDRYGPNLTRQVPLSAWEPWKIGDAVVAVPSMTMTLYPCVYTSKSTLEAHGWEMPTTEEQFETLLKEAKQAGVRPVDGSYPAWATEWFGIRTSDRAWLDDQGTVHPLTDSPEYNAYLDTMRRWHDAGYFMDPPKEGDTNYLFSSAHWRYLAEDANLAPLPLISMAGMQAVAAPVYDTPIAFESYDKPEALVTLMDWTYERSDNHELISKGEKDKDYKVIGDNGYQLLGRDQFEHSQWVLQRDLAMDGFSGHPIAGCVNPEGIQQAIAYQEAAVRPSRFLRVPAAISRYTLPDNTLRRAVDPKFDDSANAQATPTINPADEYVQGNITRGQYDKMITEQPDLQAQAYVDILQRILDKTYDPLEDMYKPTAARWTIN